jgi:hypothetical protein
MAERIVVSLHLRAAGSPESGYLRRALAAKQRAETLGGALAAWGPASFAFDFAAAEVEEAVDLALASFDDPGPRFSAGIAFGEVTRVELDGSPATLSWGRPLEVAWLLACSAEPGEVLLDERCRARMAGVLRTVGERRLGEGTVTALVLDTRRPFQQAATLDTLETADDRIHVTVPPLPPIPGIALDRRDRAQAEARRPEAAPPRAVVPAAPSLRFEEGAAPPTIRTASPWTGEPASAETTGEGSPPPAAVAEAAEGSPPPAAVAEAAEGSPPPAAVAEAAEGSSRPPVTTGATSEPEPSDGALLEAAVAELPPPEDDDLPPSATGDPAASDGDGRLSDPGPGRSSAPPLGRSSWPGVPDDYADLTAAARLALLKGNVSELERLSDELKNRGDADLADRMAGFVAWNRGAKAEGLRKLRAAADAETRPAHRVRALLAYGVALAASGRTDAALLAALGALARAREVADRQGEHVCARFLVRLSIAAGYERAARTWAAVADEIPAPRSA